MPDTQTNAFSGASSDQAPASNPTVADQSTVATQKTYTYQEGDKVKTFTGPDEVFNAYTNSQQFIGTLKNEKTAVEAELEKLKSKYSELSHNQTSTQEVLDQLKNSQVNQSAAQTQAIDQNEIVTAVREQLTLEQKQQELQNNVTKANSALTSVYGDSAAEHVAKVAGENGMTVQEAQTLAGSNPTLFNNLFLSASKQNATPTGNASFTSSSITTQQAQNSPQAQPENKLLWQMKETEAVQNLRNQREELRKQLQL